MLIDMKLLSLASLSFLSRLFEHNLFALELVVIWLGKRIQYRSPSFFNRHDYIRLSGPARMIQIKSRWECRVVGMRMIVADDPKTRSLRGVVRPLVLRGSDQITICSRLDAAVGSSRSLLVLPLVLGPV